jgi:hypothetical protein
MHTNITSDSSKIPISDLREASEDPSENKLKEIFKKIIP